MLSLYLNFVREELLHTMISTLPKPWCMGKGSEVSQLPQVVVQTVTYGTVANIECPTAEWTALCIGDKRR